MRESDGDIFISQKFTKKSIHDITCANTIHIIITKNHDFLLAFDCLGDPFYRDMNIWQFSNIYPIFFESWVEKLFDIIIDLSHFHQSTKNILGWIVVEEFVGHGNCVN